MLMEAQNIDSPELELKAIVSLMIVGARNWTKVICKKSIYS